MKTIIIAEAGVNHNGSTELAKKMIDIASEVGVDYVKFQTFKADNLVTKSAKKADYQQNNLDTKDDSQLTMLKKLELSPHQHFELIAYCKQKEIKFLSTPFDLESIHFLASLDLDLWKIPSGEITNYPYLKKIAQYGGKVILSTGMSYIKEIRDAIDVLTRWGIEKKNISILHCNTEYPTPMNDVNLRAMNTLKEELGVNVGYSDHTEGIEVSIAAVAMGANIIEKHFTLDKSMDGPDHKASLEPDELKAMVKAIRNIESALGTKEKIVSNSESKNKSIARKSIIAAKKISKGDFFTEENLAVKRPGSGISPMEWENVIGQQAICDFKEEELIKI